MSSHVIRDRIWESQKLARCSRDAALAYPWLFLVADDWGRFEFNPRRVWSKVFGAREDVSMSDVERWLLEYVEKGLLVRYHVDDELAYWTKFEGRPPSQRRKSLYPDPQQVRRNKRRKAIPTERVAEAYPTPIDKDKKIYTQSDRIGSGSEVEDGSEIETDRKASTVTPPPAQSASDIQLAQAECQRELFAANEATGIPCDELLAEASYAPDQQKVITNIANCPKLKWLKTTTSKLREKRLAHQVASRASPGRPTLSDRNEQSQQEFLEAVKRGRG
jgi:hypothetical protein